MLLALRAAVVLAVILPASLALSGCTTRLYGLQSTGSGGTTTVTSSQVQGTAKFAGGQASFSSGRVPPPGTPGGHASLGQGATAVVIGGVMLADFFNYVRGVPRPKELPADTKIMETCSCYQQQTADRDENEMKPR